MLQFCHVYFELFHVYSGFSSSVDCDRVLPQLLPIFCSINFKFSIKKQLKNRDKTPLENAFLVWSKMPHILLNLLKDRHYSVTV